MKILKKNVISKLGIDKFQIAEIKFPQYVFGGNAGDNGNTGPIKPKTLLKTKTKTKK